MEANVECSCFPSEILYETTSQSTKICGIKKDQFKYRPRRIAKTVFFVLS